MEVLDMEVVKSKSLMLPLGFNFKPAAGHGQKMVEVAIKIHEKWVGLRENLAKCD